MAILTDLWGTNLQSNKSGSDSNETLSVKNVIPEGTLFFTS